MDNKEEHGPHIEPPYGAYPGDYSGTVPEAIRSKITLTLLGERQEYMRQELAGLRSQLSTLHHDMAAFTESARVQAISNERRLTLLESLASNINNVSTGLTTLIQGVANQNLLNERRLTEIETKAELSDREVVRNEVFLDARKLAMVAGVFSIITVCITLLSHIFWS